MKQKHYYNYVSAKQKKKINLLGINNVHLITPVNITLRFLEPPHDFFARRKPLKSSELVFIFYS